MKLRVGHSISSLFLTTNWIYTQLVTMQKYEPITVARRIRSDGFVLDHLYSIDKFKNPEKFFLRVLRKTKIFEYEYYILKKSNISLLHSHFGYIGFSDLKIAQKLKIPHITTFYGCDISMPQREPAWGKKYHQLFAECELFLTEGNYMKKCLIDLGCGKEKIIVQHIGVDLEKIPYVSRKIGSDGKIKILASGTFTEKKGLPYAIEAFAHVKEKYKDIEFILIGGVPNETYLPHIKIRDAIFNVIDKYKLRDSVKILGYLPYDEYLKVSQQAHIFISPSVHAENGDTEGGAPVSIIEMSASGMPIISTFHCDIPEVVINGETGYLAPERDVDALVDKLDYLISHPEQWQDMGQKGRQHIQKEYDLIKQVEKLENLYSRLL